MNTIADSAIEHKIAVLVNEKVITSYDVVQRLKLTAIINRINIDSINNQLMINNVVDELIQIQSNIITFNSPILVNPNFKLFLG